MTIEDQIAELLAQAEPLRALPDEIAEAKGLPSLVDRINRLRLLQSFGESISNEIAAVEGADASGYGEFAKPVGDAPLVSPPLGHVSRDEANADAAKFAQEREEAKAKRGPGRPKKAE